MTDCRDPYVQTSQLAATNCEFLLFSLSIFIFLALSRSKICPRKNIFVILQPIWGISSSHTFRVRYTPKT